MNVSFLGALLMVRTDWPIRCDVQEQAVYIGDDLRLTCTTTMVRVAEREFGADRHYWAPRCAIYSGEREYLLDRLTTIVEEGTYVCRLH
jgi:hypothetical protein